VNVMTVVSVITVVSDMTNECSNFSVGSGWGM
jgi:hypothetical protein